jgi:hypothetical protein
MEERAISIGRLHARLHGKGRILIRLLAAVLVLSLATTLTPCCDAIAGLLPGAAVHAPANADPAHGAGEHLCATDAEHPPALAGAPEADFPRVGTAGSGFASFPRLVDAAVLPALPAQPPPALALYLRFGRLLI